MVGNCIVTQGDCAAYEAALLNLEGRENILDVGTGSGYQAAILSLLAATVITVEIVDQLAQSAKSQLQEGGTDQGRIQQANVILAVVGEFLLSCQTEVDLPEEVSQRIIPFLTSQSQISKAP